MIPIWLQKFATGRAVVMVLFLWLTYGILFFVLGPYATVQQAGGRPLLEETFGYGAAEVQERLHRLGQEGRVAYQTFQLLDGLNALLMTIALTLSLAFTLSRLVSARSPLRFLVYLPVLAGVGELVENSLLLTTLSSFPSEATTAAALAGPVTTAKLVAGFAALPVTVLCFVAFGIKALRNHRRRRHDTNPQRGGRN